MAGDVNIFMGGADFASSLEEGEEGEELSGAEIEVMVAEERSCRKGIAREATLLMMKYAVEQLGIRRFVAKILEKNVASQQLFQGLGFAEFKRVPVFEQIEYECVLKTPESVEEYFCSQGFDRGPLQVLPLCLQPDTAS